MTVRFAFKYRLTGVLVATLFGGVVVAARLWGCMDGDYADENVAVASQPLRLERSVDADAGLGPDAADSGVASASAEAVPPVDYLGADVDTEYILLLGFDGWTRIPGRSDSIMIVAARYDSGDLGVISVPRDLWVDIPGYEPGRINKVFRVGNLLKGPGGGHRLIKKVIEREFGLEIAYTAAVDFSGFETIVDELGGIDIEVECPIRDNFISATSKTGYEQLSLSAGQHRIGGREALLFARSRHGRTDLDRARRQQTVLFGLKRRLTRIDAIPKLPSLWNELIKYVATDIDLAGAFHLARLAASAGPGMVHGMVLGPPVVYSWRTPDGKAVLRLDRGKLNKALDDLFLAPAPGYRGKPVCPAVNAALNWRERARKYRARKAAARRSAADGGLEEDPMPVELEDAPY